MVIGDHLLSVLRLDNPWMDGASPVEHLASGLPTPFISRSVVLRESVRACLVVGPRQVGKSTLIRKTIVERGVPCLLLSCEEPSIRAWLRSPAYVIRSSVVSPSP